MRTNMNFWPAKRMLCLALCILMLVGIAMPSFDTVAMDGRESLLGRLFGVTEALAAPAESATVQYSGTSGTCTWEIYTDGTMIIRPTSGADGTLGSWSGNTSAPWYSNRAAIVSVEVQGAVHAVTCQGLFYECTNLTVMNLTGLHTSNVTSMYNMFNGCSSLTNLDVSGFDTSNVTNMYGMFSSCYNILDLNISSFDTGNVKNMGYMFNDCSSLTSLDVSGFNTSNVTGMKSMFNGCQSLRSLDISGFNTSKVTNMSDMFSGGTQFREIKLGENFAFNGRNISTSSWKAKLPTPPSLTTTGKWILKGDTSGESAMTPEQMRDAGTVTPGTWVWEYSPIAILYSNGDLVFQMGDDPIDEARGTVVKTYGGFLDTQYQSTSAYNAPWYNERSSIREVYFETDVAPACTAKWFLGCSELTSIHSLEKLDTRRVAHMDLMFADCYKLTSLNTSELKTENVISMQSMFANCFLLTSLDVSGYDTSNVNNMQSMFSGCSSLTSIDVSGFDTSNVKNMTSMFGACSSITSLDLSSFDTSNVTDMYQMFSGSSKLSRIKLGENFMFNGKNISYQPSKALLPTPPAYTTTGKWILEDDIDGGSAMTPEQMRDAGTVTAGTWVWQMKPTEYTVIYHYNDGTGNTYTEKYVAAEAATLSSTYPARFNKIVTSWNTAEDGTGTSYELGATIPANTYAIGDVVDLYAVWEDSTAFTNVSEGVYQFQIPGNAQIKLDGLPAGTVYRVSEMLPNGWILVNQSNSSGSIGPLTNSVSTFINKYMPESASAAIYATKTMDGAPATEDMAFEFTLKEGENVIQTVTAANGAVLFDPIIYTSAGTHVYTIVENWETYSGPLDASGVTFDTHVETVTVEVTDDGEGKLSAEVTYDADGPAFANRTNPGDLIITKNVIGQTAANADDTFTFTIRIKSPTGGDINSASVEIGKLPTAEQSPEPTP